MTNEEIQHDAGREVARAVKTIQRIGECLMRAAAELGDDLSIDQRDALIVANESLQIAYSAGVDLVKVLRPDDFPAEPSVNPMMN